MHIGFVSGLSDHKLSQKLAPLQAMEEVSKITLFRRQPFIGKKVVWQPMPGFASRNSWIGDLWRMVQLLYHGSKCDLLVGCHQRFHGVLAAIAGKVVNIPSAQLVITEFDVMWGHPAYRWAIRQAVLVGVRGQKAKGKSINALVNTSAITFIPPNLFSPTVLAESDLTGNRDIDILFVGSFTYEKNIPILVQVLERIKDKQGSLKGCIIGKGPKENYLRKELNKLGLQNDVKIIDHLPQASLGAYYQRAKLLLLPSRSEGFPMVIPEAMGWGVPVVATDVGDISDIIIDGKNGFLAENGNCDALFEACNIIIGDTNLAHTMSAQAKLTHNAFVTDSRLEVAVDAWQKALLNLRELSLLPTK
ncbi:MAG: glycosyltransferase family 4 protein [Magnetococcales bacterium]|nr:glycosyltransferase family 4 protein [Magnetococcales bacterium]